LRAKIVVLLPVRHRWTATNAVVQNGLEPVELRAREIRMLVDHNPGYHLPLVSLLRKGCRRVEPENHVTHDALEGLHQGTERHRRGSSGPPERVRSSAYRV